MCCCRCRCRCRCCCCWIESIKDRFWEKRHWFFPCHDKFHLSSCQTLQCLDSFTYTSTYIYTLWWTNIAIENGPFFMGKLTISTGPFSIAMLVHQRVYIIYIYIYYVYNIWKPSSHPLDLGSIYKHCLSMNIYPSITIYLNPILI